MSDLITHRGIILGELVSIMTRFPLIPVAHILEEATVAAGHGTFESRTTDAQLADALKFYSDKLHEEVMNGVVTPKGLDEGGATVEAEAGAVS